MPQLAYRRVGKIRCDAPQTRQSPRRGDFVLRNALPIQVCGWIRVLCPRGSTQRIVTGP
jgi:hypothetical protein